MTAVQKKKLLEKKIRKDPPEGKKKVPRTMEILRKKPSCRKHQQRRNGSSALPRRWPNNLTKKRWPS